MKRNTLFIKNAVLLAMGIIVMFSQCRDRALEPLIQPDSKAAKIYLKSKAPTPQHFTKDASQNFTFTTDYGMQFSFNANSFYSQSGSAITGNVDIEVTEYMDKESMIASGVTTQSDNNILISAGMFNISVSQNGSELALASNYTVFVPANTVDNKMSIFQGIETVNANGDTTVNWVQNDSAGQLNSTLNGYVVNLPFLSWCNLDKYIDAPVGSQVRLKLPTEFTSKNTTVYMVFETNSVVYLFGDAANKEFNSGSYFLPLGWDLTFLAISSIDDELYYGMLNSTIVNNHLETISEMKPISEADLDVVIENL